MALIKLNELEQEIGSFLPFIGSVIDFKRVQQVSKAIGALYDQTDALAVLVVQDIAAFLWWAAHLAAAADDALGYSAQIQTAIDHANARNMETWQLWLNVKYPADLRSLYDALQAEIDQVRKGIPKQQHINLKPILRRLSALEHWQKVTVTPELTKWTRFYDSWRRTYRPPVLTLIGWLRHPATFGKWAVMPVLSETPSQLRKRANSALAASIGLALTQTWTSDPQPIFDAVTQWLVTGS